MNNDNRVNVNPNSLTEKKLDELRQYLVDLGLKLIDGSRDKRLGEMDILTAIGGVMLQGDADIRRTIAQLSVLDELTRPVGSRGGVHHDA